MITKQPLVIHFYFSDKKFPIRKLQVRLQPSAMGEALFMYWYESPWTPL